MIRSSSLKHFLLVGLWLFLAISSFSQVRIPLKSVGGVFILPCTVNGLKLEFIFDTGASSISISLSEAIFMLKNGYIKDEDLSDNISIQDATGQISIGQTVILKEVIIGGIKLQNIKATIVNSLQAPLLLGNTVMKELGRVEIDFNSNAIIITEKSISYFEKEILTDSSNTDLKLQYADYINKILSNQTATYPDSREIENKMNSLYESVSKEMPFNPIFFDKAGDYYFRQWEKIKVEIDLRQKSQIDQTLLLAEAYYSSTAISYLEKATFMYEKWESIRNRLTVNEKISLRKSVDKLIQIFEWKYRCEYDRQKKRGFQIKQDQWIAFYKNL